MKNSDVQKLLAFAGFYKGGIDGVIGDLSLKSVQTVLGSTGMKWSLKRRLIGAAQTILNNAGYSAGTVDGYDGHNTQNAFSAWMYKIIHGRDELVVRKASKTVLKSSKDLPRQKDVREFYGRPGSQIKGRLKTVQLPYKLRIDWNLRQSVSRITLHELCVDSFIDAMVDVKKHYGPKRMKSLGIDRYAGGYNHRKMRGGSKWSMHAYGCAVDFFAAPNGLRMRCPEALFCGKKYVAFLDIMESHGWLPAVRLWGADAMHFQQARL